MQTAEPCSQKLKGGLLIDLMSVVRWVFSVDVKKVLDNSNASFYLFV